MVQPGARCLPGGTIHKIVAEMEGFGASSRDPSSVTQKKLETLWEHERNSLLWNIPEIYPFAPEGRRQIGVDVSNWNSTIQSWAREILVSYRWVCMSVFFLSTRLVARKTSVTHFNMGLLNTWRCNPKEWCKWWGNLEITAGQKPNVTLAL